jgi:chemotaxis protein CheZ
VEVVLIGKNRGALQVDRLGIARFVGSRFILRQRRAVMVNRGFRADVPAMNAILSCIGINDTCGDLGSPMPVQRKVFRIEEHARPRAPQGVSAAEPQSAERHREFMAELQALRTLIEPRTEAERDALERARAQIAEAQAYKHELAAIHAAVEHTKSDMAALDAPSDERTARARHELSAIVGGTEQATKAILQAAEDIDQAAAVLSAALKNPQDAGLASDIQDRVVQIFEACNFQDLTGQRVAHVLATLRMVEERMARLLQIWRGVEQFTPIVCGGDGDAGRRLLYGPKLPGDRGHASQDDIDLMFFGT